MDEAVNKNLSGNSQLASYIHGIYNSRNHPNPKRPGGYSVPTGEMPFIVFYKYTAHLRSFREWPCEIQYGTQAVAKDTAQGEAPDITAAINRLVSEVMQPENLVMPDYTLKLLRHQTTGYWVRGVFHDFI